MPEKTRWADVSIHELKARQAQRPTIGPIRRWCAKHSQYANGCTGCLAESPVAPLQPPRPRARMAKATTSRPKVKLPRFDWADTLQGHLHALHLPCGERDYRFHPTRKWKMDLAWPALKLSVEVDGSEDSHGKHGRGAGMRNDCTKQNAAVELGWRPLRFTGKQVKSGEALAVLERMLKTI